MLLFDLIDYNVLTPGFSKFIINEATRNGGEKKQVEEDKDNEKDVIGLIVLNCKDLIVRIEVVCSYCVDLIYHFSKIIVVHLQLVKGNRIIGI